MGSSHVTTVPITSAKMTSEIIFVIFCLAYSRYQVDAIDCNLNGQCDGHFLGSEVTSDISDCIYFCRETKDCEWFTWNQEKEICVALSDCPYLDESKPDTISGQRDCSVYTCGQQGFCKGITVDIQVARNEDYCLKLCQKETKCNWYSFNAENNVCTLQEDCPEIDKSCLSCYFGQKECMSEASKLTVVLSNTADIGFQLFDIEHDSVLNSQIPEYPAHIDYPAEMIFDEEYGVVRACGGEIRTLEQNSTNARRSETEKCFMFDGFSWTEMVSVPESLSSTYYSFRLSVQVKNEGWWIYEGNDHQGNNIKSYLFDKNQTWKEGPIFPDYGYSDTPYEFCGAQVNATHTIVTGGEINGGSSISDVWFYNWEDKSWQPGPNMTIPRRSHTCIGISNNRVMVAGGTGLYGEDLVSVEIYDPALKPGGEWYQVQDLPEDDYSNSYESTLLFNSQIIWINENNIWKFVDNEWVMLDNQLQYDIYSPLTILVPENFATDGYFENQERL